ncbi:MAG TPA: sulfatase [Prolixibacteraceae bacterium]|nr:sulfatase [Prolixibacteraceae bacterium]
MKSFRQIPVLLIFVLSLSACSKKENTELPNILWLTSEDNSPLLGCYGDTFATTPNLDKLAAEGFLYTRAFANTPVCAPTRNTILTGVYACSGGNEHMRSFYSKSDMVKTYPEYLRQVGYYCTNNVKTDYNLGNFDDKSIWDDCSNKAHYKNRPEGKPFFAVFNCTISHESCLHKSTPDSLLRHRPENVPLPPYHPATPEMKHDWAQYYDKVENLDTWVGEKLKELDEAGLAENTIVFYYSDHGGVIARSKRYLYDTGTRVPFIIRIPEKYKHLFPSEKPGSKVDRLISWIDLVPTLLSIAGVPVPEYLQGSAFIGKQKARDPEYVYLFRGRMDERYDMSRAVRDKKFRYIRNYMSHRSHGQHLEYLWKAPSVDSWEKAFLRGECNEVQSAFWKTKTAEELYDVETDPWEINNLAGNSEYKEVLERMRKANRDHLLKILDTGFLPEADRIERVGETPIYDFMRNGNVDLPAIIDAAETATLGNVENIEKLKSYLKSNESAIRYWGATGLLILGENAAAAKPDLTAALNDSSLSVSTVAAEALYNLGERPAAVKSLVAVLTNGNEMARCFALNTIDLVNDASPEIQMAVIELAQNSPTATRELYDMRMAKWLFEKWKLEPDKYGVKFNW